MRYLKQHWWDVVFVCALVTGFGFGIRGFVELTEEEYGFGGALWETFRLFDREYHVHEIPTGLATAQWLLLFAFLWLSLKVIITIIAPDLISNLKVSFFYRDHIVICGEGAIVSTLIDENRGEKIIVLAGRNDEYFRSLKHRGVILIVCGAGFDEHFLRRAKVGVADRVWIATGDDRKNVEVTKTVFSLVEGGRSDDALKCYTIVEDCELKRLLDESRLFKYRTDRFDPILINVNETGIRYAVAMNIWRIVPPKPEAAPEILVAGLTGRAESVIFDLAHCLTMTRKVFRFTVVESKPERILAFKKRYPWLKDFAQIEYADDAEKACESKRFDSVFVCHDKKTDAVKAAIDIRNAIGADNPDIFIVSEGSGGFIEVLDMEERNIFFIDALKQAVKYVVELDPQVELHARAAHDNWRERDARGNFTDGDEYHTLSAHFKQTNRSQVLDNYLRAWLATGQTLDAKIYAPAVFSSEDMETLAMMEHRRWMIEKLDDGWRHAVRSDNRFKRRNNLVLWNELPGEEKKKDYDAIELMLKLLNTPHNEDSLHPETP